MSKTKNKVIEQQNKLREAEEKARREGNKSPFAFISEVSKKIFVF